MTYMNNQFDILHMIKFLNETVYYTIADKTLAIMRYNYDLYFILQSSK